MATVRLVVNFRVKPGRYPDLLESIKAVKKAIGQLGGSLIVNRQIVGPETGNIFAVAVYEDWAAFAKSRTDPELTRAVDAIRTNRDPAFDAITVSLSEEVTI